MYIQYTMQNAVCLLRLFLHHRRNEPLYGGAELGVPVAAFSADQADPAEWNPAQLATRLDALSEQMERRTL